MTDGKKQKIAIYGGSFDPPHYGHYDIVKNLEKSFDTVIVVPSAVSPFKTDSEAENSKARYKLCKKVFSSEKTLVSDREIKRGDISYSVDTVSYFVKKYRGADFTFVIGSEELPRLPEWHDADRLKTLVAFFVVSRPGYPIAQDTVKALKKRGYKIKQAKFTGLDVSSTRIKLDLAFGKTNKYMPSVVYAAAEKDGSFDVYGKYVDALYKYGLDDKRIEHTYGVAARGAELAKLYGYSVHDAVVACLLHDIAKSVDASEYRDKTDTKGFPPPTVHAPIGAYVAKKEFNVSTAIAHAIYVHTTAEENMSLLDEIVYLADKTEEGRRYKGVSYLRYLCEVDKDLAMKVALGSTAELNESTPCDMSERAIAYYEKRCEGKVPPVPQKAAKQENKTIKPVRKSVGNGNKRAVVSDNDPVRAMATAVANELCLHKGRDVDIVDLGEKTIVADYFVIASVSSSTAVKALMGYAEDLMTKKYGLDPMRRDVNTEWVALDYGGIIIHIFTDKTREFYNIERLWSDGNNITRVE